MTRKRLILGLGLVVLVGSLLVPSLRHWLFNNAGRWHIVLLHFPIGTLLLAGLLELYKGLGLKGITREVMGIILGFGTIAAILTALTGLVLHEQGGYDHELVEWHERLGIATAIAAMITFVLHRTGRSLAYRISLALTAILITLAGHYGGSLTHGEEFLTEQLGNWDAPGQPLRAVVDIEEALVWEHVIRPIFEQKCVSCHNPSKRKGGLVLQDSAAIHRGGEHGSVLDLDAEMGIYAVIAHPIDHDMHMPPRGKAQLSDEEKAMIRWWVEKRAPFQKRVLDLEASPEMADLFQEHLGPQEPIDLLGIEPLAASELEALVQEGYRIQQTDPEKPWLAVNLSDRQDLSENDLGRLEDIQENITHMDLGNSRVSEAVMEWVAECAQLKELKLDQCTVKADDLAQLSGLEHLQYLNLYSAQLTGDGQAALSQFGQLKRLYLWQSSLSKETVAALRTQLHPVEVIADSPGEDFPAQAMIPPEFINQTIFLNKGEPFPLMCRYPGVEIRYTLDGSEPNATSPVLTENTVFQQSGKIKARSYLYGWEPSTVVEQTFLNQWPEKVTVVKADAGDAKYPGNAGAALTDRLVGESLITDKQWLGRWGKNFDVVLDLGRQQTISGIGVHALEDTKSWVFFPKEIRVEGGATLSSMKTLANQSFDESSQLQGGRSQLFQVAIQEPVRYVRIQVQSYGQLPEWHESAGQPSWLFVDEVAVY